LFIDFDSGDLLTLTGTAEVVWDGDKLKAFDGAERAWRFRIESGWRLRDALPLRWAFRDLSPHSAITGTWVEAEARRQAQRLAQTWRPYQVTHIVDESRVIRSFHLAPADGLAVPTFLAGQHLPIRLKTAAGEELHRTYTISQAPGDEGLRLSVKREGVASSTPNPPRGGPPTVKCCCAAPYPRQAAANTSNWTCEMAGPDRRIA
jgi:hypothetical protein